MCNHCTSTPHPLDESFDQSLGALADFGQQTRAMLDAIDTAHWHLRFLQKSVGLEDPERIQSIAGRLAALIETNPWLATMIEEPILQLIKETSKQSEKSEQGCSREGTDHV